MKTTDEHFQFISQFRSAGDVLSAWFHSRRERNSRYSIRAFAKHLSISHSTLIRAMNGSRTLSVKRLKDIGQRLGFTHKSLEYFCALGERPKTAPTTQLNRLRNAFLAKKIDPTYMRVLSKSHHFTILQMLRYPEHFPFSLESWSDLLSLSEKEITSALNVLEKLNLIQKHSSQGYVRSGNRFIAEHQGAHPALQQFHRSFLYKAAENIGQGDPEGKFVGTETFGFSKKALPAAFEIIEEALDKLVGLAGDLNDRDSIYHINVSLFPLVNKSIPKD